MEEKKVIGWWAERLKAEPDTVKRNEIIAEMCKEHGIKTGEAFKKLKEAGFDPKTSSPEATPGNPEARQDEKKTPVVLRHKTDYTHYRSSGLVLTQKPETYEVTALQMAKLKIDPWVEIVKAEEKEAKAE